MEIKEFKTFEEQVAKLIEHGCEDIVSKEYAINILKRINYYRLTAYFLPFRDEESQNQKSAYGTTILDSDKWNNHFISCLKSLFTKINLAFIYII